MSERTLPCERCGQPVVVKKPTTQWAVHWRCVVPSKDKGDVGG